LHFKNKYEIYRKTFCKNFKLSQTTKDVFDVIRAISSYFSIATLGCGVILFAIDEQLIIGFFISHKILALIIGGTIVLIPPLAPLLYKRIRLVILKQRNLSNIIIERQDVVIDIIRKGKRANYFERLCFYRIGKNYNQYLSKLIVTGIIESDSIHCQNCFYNLNNEQNKLTISYVNNSKKLHSLPSLGNWIKWLNHHRIVLYS